MEPPEDLGFDLGEATVVRLRGRESHGVANCLDLVAILAAMWTHEEVEPAVEEPEPARCVDLSTRDSSSELFSPEHPQTPRSPSPPDILAIDSSS